MNAHGNNLDLSPQKKKNNCNQLYYNVRDMNGNHNNSKYNNNISIGNATCNNMNNATIIIVTILCVIIIM